MFYFRFCIQEIFEIRNFSEGKITINRFISSIYSSCGLLKRDRSDERSDNDGIDAKRKRSVAKSSSAHDATKNAANSKNTRMSLIGMVTELIFIMIFF